ncbi:hypothetical protein GBAR_LOCUS24660 [Geodia barretti]|uniref:Uncharacterized protein n=1 Tax=Geodia barretti TaxID=519541 RepID=A0AA35XBA3_GEOBA|nr:hypothetical protein GBAR_LOCUS24660 [Geodia barretti]
MYDAHNRTIVLVPFSYRPLLQLETWHSVSHYLMKLEKLLWPFKHRYRSTPHNNHQLSCGLSPPACRLVYKV